MRLIWVRSLCGHECAQGFDPVKVPIQVHMTAWKGKTNLGKDGPKGESLRHPCQVSGGYWLILGKL